MELFLSRVRSELINPNNIRRPRDNLTKQERLAITSLNNNDIVLRIQDKGSRFVILNYNDYECKMLTQLNNSLHYQSIVENPTLNYFDIVKNWAAKWFDKMQITKDIAEWICNAKPKPGVAFGNVKTHKPDNPVRLITSCCGTAIEKLSAFTEFYLKPLAQKSAFFCERYYTIA